MNKQVIILRELNTTSDWHDSVYASLRGRVKVMLIDITNENIISWFQQHIDIHKDMILVMSINTLLYMYDYFDYRGVTSPYAIFAVVDIEPQEIIHNSLVGDYYLYTFTDNKSDISISGVEWRDGSHVRQHIGYDSLTISILNTLNDLSITFDDVANKLDRYAQQFLLDITEKLEMNRSDIIQTDNTTIFIIKDINRKDAIHMNRALKDGYVSNPYWTAKISFDNGRGILSLQR